MGPIKINIKTDTSEYGSGAETNGTSEGQISDNASASDNKSSEPNDAPPNGDQIKTDAKSDDTVYEYEGDDCFYTEPSSGVRYKWSKVSNSWVNTKTGEAQSSGQPPGDGAAEMQKNYKMEDGTYVYVDRLTNKKHKWNLETNTWDEVENTDDVDDDDDESEEDENMSEEDRKARQYRKRKAAPGWDQSNYSKVF